MPKKPTYKQDWSAYNVAQATEKRRVRILLHDLCHNLTCLIQEQETLGITRVFLKDEGERSGPAILPMKRIQPG